MRKEAAPSDLTTRERVGMTIDIELMKRFREKSLDTGIPMSRMLDKAIERILLEK